jgi:hypothetical protein
MSRLCQRVRFGKNVAVEGLPVFCMWEILCWNLGRQTWYPGWFSLVFFVSPRKNQNSFFKFGTTETYCVLPKSFCFSLDFVKLNRRVVKQAHLVGWFVFRWPIFLFHLVIIPRSGLKIAVFWAVAPCSLVEVYQRFRGPCCLHHQTTRCYNPEDRHLRTHRRENLKSYHSVVSCSLEKISYSIELVGDRQPVCHWLFWWRALHFFIPNGKVASPARK